jgi:hypothetical protein
VEQATDMTAREIQSRLIVERYRRNFVMPNYTPSKWWECDVFEITEAGFFVEYEIKLTRSDFRADASKQKEKWEVAHNVQIGRSVWQRIPGEKKHEVITQGRPTAPRRFWYVMPAGLIAQSELPPWAGLIECHEVNHHRHPYRVVEQTVVPAPTLHHHKIDPKIKLHAQGVCYWRMHHLILHRQPTNERPA